MKLKGYTETTFGKLKIGDTFNREYDVGDPEFVKRVKVGSREAKYADGMSMVSPENDWDSSETVYIKPAQ